MIVKDEKLLDEFRASGRCEACGRWCYRREANHVFSRGMGGASRVDIRENLTALGGPWECACHAKYHAGAIGRAALLAIVAKREGLTVAAIREKYWAVLRAPKGVA